MMNTVRDRRVMRETARTRRRVDDLVLPEMGIELIGPHLALPGLRAFYPMSAQGAGGQAIDVTIGNQLTYNGNPAYGYDDQVPYCRYDGTGDYHDIADAASGNIFDILGTETIVQSAYRGLSVSAWIYPEETSTLEYILSKWGGAGNRAYVLFIDASDQINFAVSDDGTNFDTATSAAVTMSAWYHVVGRFRPSAFVDVFVNGVLVEQATARAAVANSATNFSIGAQAGGTLPYQGRVSLGAVCAMALSDELVRTLYEQTRGAFGV